MMLIGLIGVALLLGGLLAHLWPLWQQPIWRGTWYQLARARAVLVRPVWQSPAMKHEPMARGGGALSPPDAAPGWPLSRPTSSSSPIRWQVPRAQSERHSRP